MKRSFYLLTQFTFLTIIASVWTNQGFAFSTEETLSKMKIPKRNFGFLLIDAKTKETLDSYNANKTFIPASTLKIVSLLSGLEILGKDHKFATEIKTDNQSIQEQTLEGDLYLIGGSDPTLEAPHLMQVCQSLKSKGISKIKGSFFFDDSRITRSTNISRYMEENASYNPGISALSLEFNLYRGLWGKTENPQKLDFFKQLIPGNSTTDQTRLPIKKGARYTAHIFGKICKNIGIDLPKPKRKKEKQNLYTLVAHQSRSLADIVPNVMHYSNNLSAELIGLEAALKLHQKKQSLYKSAQTLKKYWKNKLPQTSFKGFHWVNHSGLTPLSRITPKQMIAFVQFAFENELYGESFFYHTSISGWRGRLRHVLKPFENSFQVWAKPGGIDYSKALAGIIYTNSGRKLLFSVFNSDFSKRKLFDSKKIPKEDDYRRQKKIPKVFAFETFLKHWIETY